MEKKGEESCKEKPGGWAAGDSESRNSREGMQRVVRGVLRPRGIRRVIGGEVFD